MTPADAVELGHELRSRREAAGLSLRQLAQKITPHLPEREWVTDEAIRAYETGKVKRHNYALLIAIGKVLGFTLTDLSPELAEDAQELRDLLEAGIRCSRTFAGAA